jgi:hypothetical protein
MADERDDGSGAVERRRSSRRLVDPRRPSRPSLEQQARDGGDGLGRPAGGIEEPLPVEVIAAARAARHEA